MTRTPAAGWYPDPADSSLMRWWDGAAWTAQTQRVPQAQPVGPSGLQMLPPPSSGTAYAAGAAAGAGEQAGEKTRKKLPLWAWVVIGVLALAAGILLSPIFTVLWLVVLITGIAALAKNTPTWLRLRSRKTATIVTAISAACFLLTGSVANAVIGGNADRPTDASPATTALESPALPSPSAEPTETETPAADEEAEPVPFAGDSSTVADTSSTEGMTALQVLETLPVKGRAAKTGYDRDQFGQRWLDVDRNGCDTRNDILARDLTAIARSGPCRVLAGTLSDPFTGQAISFVRGQGTSELVQIDHVVALSDAWQKGAQQLTADQRATFANDPLNLLAVDGSANAQKGDGDAATWLPTNTSFRCEYVARQVAVKGTYGLWVTQAEHDAITRVLSACPEEPVLTSGFAKVVPVKQEPTPTPTSAPAPVKEEPAPAPKPAAPAPAPAPVEKAPVSVYYENCTAVRVAGAAPIRTGDPGYSRKLDRDGDGVACE